MTKGTSTAPPAVRRAVRPFATRWLGLQVRGTAHVPDDGAVIIAATHQSHADSLALGSASPRPLTFLGSAHLPPALRHFGMVPITRGTADAEALHRCLEVLEAGGALAVFPEGGRSRDGHVHRLRSGVARLACAVRCPVVPAGITGTARLWPADERPRLRSGHVMVTFGRALPPPAATAPGRRAFNEELHDALVALSGLPAATTLLRSSSVLKEL
jgi:1-acyl-sn-glycerol-3-phosphate acyltransferase